MSSPSTLFWDSCVFIRWLTRTPDAYVADIEQYIGEARRGRIKIAFSTIAYAEIRPRFLRQHVGVIEQLFAELGSAFFPIDPLPSIMIAAGQLRDAECTNPSDPKIDRERKRVIGTADAIQLMTCIYARDVLEIPDIVFHTLDDGKTRGHEGRCIPLLSFERWFPEPLRVGRVADVCGLNRALPVHPSPDLVTSARGSMESVSSPKH